jgi:hypothetical protein
MMGWGVAFRLGLLGDGFRLKVEYLIHDEFVVFFSDTHEFTLASHWNAVLTGPRKPI